MFMTGSKKNNKKIKKIKANPQTNSQIMRIVKTGIVSVADVKNASGVF